MFPLIRKGDWIYIEPITENNLQSGDIILFSVNQRFVVHRIVNIENDQLVTKGDWSRSLDPSITKVNVIGKLVAIKKGKYKLTLNHPFLRIQNQLIRLLNQKILNFRLRRIN
jgi:signal peptidase I